MPYVDGFLLAVPTDNKDAYKAFAEKMWPVIKDLGAVAMWECWGNDIPDGEVTSFPMAVKKEDNEVVVFAWIEWPDKATRDAGNKKMMDDPRVAAMDPKKMPFDGMRMIFGGFEVLAKF
ncbi:MAG: DUF1428 domain-containing protein [Pseudomonadota bacterium]